MIVIARCDGFTETKGNAIATFHLRAATFESWGFQSLETYNAMNWRKFVLLGCAAVCIFAASIATAQMRGHVISMSRMGVRGPLTPPSIARMPMRGAPTSRSIGPMRIYRAPMMNSALGLRRFNRFNDGNFNRHDRFRRFKHFNEIIFIGNFASPWWWGPCWGWNWGYPYVSYGYSYPSDYSAYGYGTVTMTRLGSSGYGYGYVTRLGITTAAITAARTMQMTMRVLCAMFSPNMQFLGTAMTWPASVVSSLKTVTT